MGTLKQSRTVLCTAILVKLALQFLLVLPVYELHRDEFLHIDQGKHLAWGYVSVPPLTSWTSWIVLQFGASEFLVRLIPALWGVLTLIVVYRTVRLLGGGTYAVALALACTVFSALMRLNMLYQPNSADIFFWTMLLYLMIAYQKTLKNRYLYIAAISFAVAVLNKYNIAFLAAGLAVGILLTGARRILANKHFYISACLALAVLLPHLWWQDQNGFPVFSHMAELRETQLNNVDRADFLFEQLLFFAGALWIIAAGWWFLMRMREYRFVGIAFVATLSLFLLMRAKGYYAIGLYPAIIAVGAVWFSRFENLWLRAALVAVPVVLFGLTADIAFPLRSPEYIAANPDNYNSLGLLRWEDGQEHALPQDFADMLGWRELAGHVDLEARKLAGKTLVLCDNYGQAGAINFYAPGLDAVSFNADYANWFPKGKIDNVILVREAGNTDLITERALFAKIRGGLKIEKPNAREFGTQVIVLEEPRIDIAQRIQSDRESRR